MFHVVDTWTCGLRTTILEDSWRPTATLHETIYSDLDEGKKGALMGYRYI
jgi:hypothetical protein